MCQLTITRSNKYLQKLLMCSNLCHYTYWMLFSNKNVILKTLHSDDENKVTKNSQNWSQHNINIAWHWHQVNELEKRISFWKYRLIIISQLSDSQWNREKTVLSKNHATVKILNTSSVCKYLWRWYEKAAKKLCRNYWRRKLEKLAFKH